MKDDNDTAPVCICCRDRWGGPADCDSWHVPGQRSTGPCDPAWTGDYDRYAVYIRARLHDCIDDCDGDPCSTTTLTWLGAHPRRTLWRTSPGTPECLGWITIHGDTWSAYLPPLTVDGPPRRLRGYDDEIAAARALCVYLRVGDVALPTLTDEDDE